MLVALLQLGLPQDNISDGDTIPIHYTSISPLFVKNSNRLFNLVWISASADTPFTAVLSMSKTAA